MRPHSVKGHYRPVSSQETRTSRRSSCHSRADAGSALAAPKPRGIGTPSPIRRRERWLERHIERTGLRPRDAAYLIATFWAIAVVVFGVVERLVDPKTFPSVWLGMWWAVETVTTVGYGDIVPNQTAGKIIAALLMLGGLSLIAVVTAAITSGFVSRTADRRRAAGEDPVMQKLEAIAAELQDVKAELDRLLPTAGTDDSPGNETRGN
jgi:voltage-gated potassium channel